jgi:hypothetical protein
MSCELTSHLLDDYLDKQLSQREQQRLEQHISVCPRCAQELQERLVFERTLRHVLTSAVQRLQLTPDASKQILWAVGNDAQQSAWRGYAARVAQGTAAAAVAVLLLAGMFLLLGRVPGPSGVQQGDLPPASRAIFSLDRGNISVEPGTPRPGALFTVTVPIDDKRLRLLDILYCDLDIRGPTGRYRYGLAVRGPLPERGALVLQVTPSLLANPSREQYNIAVQDILGMPGVYHFRVTLSGQATPLVE